MLLSFKDVGLKLLKTFLKEDSVIITYIFVNEKIQSMLQAVEN